MGIKPVSGDEIIFERDQGTASPSGCRGPTATGGMRAMCL